MKGWKTTGTTERIKQKANSRTRKNGGSDKDFSCYFKPERRKKTGLLAAALLAASVPTAPVYASNLIGTVKVEFSESGSAYENGLPEIEGETDSSKYSLDEITTLEEYMSQWEDADEEEDEDENDRKDNSDLLAYNETYLALKDYSQVVYAVLIEAEGDYYFSSSLEGVKVSGLGAECVRAERLYDKTTLVLFVRFDELNHLFGELEEAGWSGAGKAAWSCSGNPAWYELRLYKDGKIHGQTRQTGGTAYDFQPLMQEAGTYRYQIRAVSLQGKAGGWFESEPVSISAEQAAGYRSEYEVIPVYEAAREEAGPPVITGYQNTGWQTGQDGGYWYREDDGSYPQLSWRNVDGYWYFFGQDGYMEADSYISWGNQTYYVGSDGKMLTGGLAPDGRLVQTDGSLSWPER